jgi:hypothetical protein
MESKNYHLFLGMYTQWRLSSVRCAVLISKLIQKSLADINFVQINNNIDLWTDEFMEPNWHPCVTSVMSSGNKKTVHPSFLATLMMYVAFSFFSSTTEKKMKWDSWGSKS